MPRNGSGVFSLPAGSIVTDGDTIEATQHNTPLNDLATDANTARPIVAGGTGATTVADARTNFGLGTADAVTFASLTATTALTSPSLTNAGTLALTATGANVITASTNGSERLRLDSSGNLGIGTTSPGTRLELRTDVAASSSGATTMLTLRNGSDGGSGIEFTNSVSAKSKISLGVEGTGGSTDDSYIGFSTAANAGTLTERMRVSSAGNVGIGTNAPSATLDVVGTIELNSLPLYACRAWVVFDGTTGTVAQSGNVTSVTRNGVGDYTINLTTAMTDTNFAVVAQSGPLTDTSSILAAVVSGRTTSTATILLRNDGGLARDSSYVSVAIFR